MRIQAVLYIVIWNNVMAYFHEFILPHGISLEMDEGEIL